MTYGFTGRLAAVVLLGMAVSPALASERGELGYKQGALGVSAILASDFQTAEQQLNRLDGVAARDPLRLINLGNVYAATGRPFDAQKAYVAAYNAPSVEIVTADGRDTTTREVARIAMGRLRMSTAAR
ncbi:hypothetical protein BH10PSE12_BH10PSE12_19900 [soil metagenome]